MYRFDCGSGVGQVLMNEVAITDGKWHNITIVRRGNHAKLSLDNTFHADGYADGNNKVLNLQSNDMYFGAEVCCCSLITLLMFIVVYNCHNL